MKARFNKPGFQGLERRVSAVALTGFLICAGGNIIAAAPVAATPAAPPTNTITVPLRAAEPEPQPVLDAKRLFALGMIETGNNDREVGKAGEISRYQIHPIVWKAYSKSAEYRNPEVSVTVAQQHWTKLAGYFREKTGRQPSDFDMYVMWNTRFGYYAHKGFSPARIGAIVQDRAQRFVNLVNRKG